jgi:hypothetical protein
MTGRQTRAERATSPLARDSIRKIAEASGGCLRPVQLRRTDAATGETVSVMVPCGATLASICPPCAERAKVLRAAQCREGWHLEDEPDLSPAAPDEMQEFWLALRAEAQLRRDTAAAAGQGTTGYDELIGELDTEITRAGIRGKVTTSRSSSDGKQHARRSRSTRRRQDAVPLPTRKIAPRTTGRVYTAPDGKRYRPSMFLTLTCDSYGKSTLTAPRPTQPRMTTPGRPGTRSTSPPCWTGSSRTCAGCSDMKRSTSAAWNRKAAT